MFSVGDIIHKKYDFSKRYIIQSIRIEKSGNLLDGCVSEIATIKDVDNGEESEYKIYFHEYGNFPQHFVILYDKSVIERLNRVKRI
jgi:hypothetical protein